MEHSPSEANSHSASQEILKISLQCSQEPAPGPYPELD